MDDRELQGLARFVYEVGQLKRSARTGWWMAGVANVESVAEHSMRTAVLGYLLAQLEGADAERTAVLCLFHDLAETRIGDIPYVGKEYLHAAHANEVVADQVRDLPGPAASAVAGAVGEYELHESLEAALARDADRLECLLQAREYQAQGAQEVTGWIESSLAGLRSVTAKRLAETCLDASPGDWWRVFLEGRRRARGE
ncbi:MAG TPA: HD domain-containing protein [Actinomycetota bacterium]|nr:HD domain-containing protein [Actinomycetota bacterium]